MKMFVAIILGATAIVLLENGAQYFGWSFLGTLDLIFGIIGILTSVLIVEWLAGKYIKNPFLRWSFAIGVVGLLLFLNFLYYYQH